MRYIFLVLILCWVINGSYNSYAQDADGDELLARGHYSPDGGITELLDIEVYSNNIVYAVGVGGYFFMDVRDITNPTLIGHYDPGNAIKYRFYNSK